MHHHGNPYGHRDRTLQTSRQISFFTGLPLDVLLQNSPEIPDTDSFSMYSSVISALKKGLFQPLAIPINLSLLINPRDTKCYHKQILTFPKPITN